MMDLITMVGKQNECMGKRIEELKVNEVILKSSIDALTQQLNEAEAEVEKLKELNKKLCANVKRATEGEFFGSDLEPSESSSQSEALKSAELVKRLTADLAASQKLLQQYKENTVPKAMYDKLKEQIDTLERKVALPLDECNKEAVTREQYDEIALDLKNAKSELKSKEDCERKIAEFSALVNDKDLVIAKLNSLVDDQRSDNAKLKKRIGELDKVRENLNQLVSSQGFANKKLRETVSELRQEIANLHATSNDDLVRSYSEDLDYLVDVVEKKDAEIKRQNDQIVKLENQLFERECTKISKQEILENLVSDFFGDVDENDIAILEEIANLAEDKKPSIVYSSFFS